MNHLIRKQEIALRIHAGVDAFRIQHAAKSYYYDKVMPVLEKLFDEFSNEHSVVELARLEINLGALGWKDGQLLMEADAIYEVCKQQLQQQLTESGVAQDERLVSRKTAEEHACLQWIFYMVNGVLPWEVKMVSQEWLMKVIHQLAIDHVLISRVRSLIRQDGNALARIAGEHEDGFLVKLAEVLTASPQPQLADLRRNQRASQRHFPEGVPWQRLQWPEILRQAAAGVVDLSGTTQAVQLAMAQVEEQVDTWIPPSQKPDEIYGAHAGLILLHPFVRQLFVRLGLLKEGQFRDKMCLQKAVLILHFLATGKQDFQEHTLAVPKIICGMLLEEAMMDDVLPLETEVQNEALDMMHAAIAQWEVLGNTSVAAFREGFIDREARINIEERRITFRVETKGIDVLLDHLPWNLSLVTFPWLQTIIHVQWR